MTESAIPAPAVSVEEMQRGWQDLTARVGLLEAENKALEHDNKALRFLLERITEHRQKSHGELILLLTNLVSKLPITDVGVVVSKLVEHNRNVNQTLAGFIKGAASDDLPLPAVLQTLEQTKRGLHTSLKAAVDELISLDPSYETPLLRSLCDDPNLFFSPRVARANRCFVKGQVPRERILREFGQEALVFFNDLTTDPKLNPRPKPDEIALGFKPEFEALLQQNPSLLPDKRQELLALYQKVQAARATTEQALAQKLAFLKLSFVLELLHFYENESTESPEAVFAQRLPGLIEQLGLSGPQERLEQQSLALAESLMAYIINQDLRQMLVNNIGKASPAGKLLKLVLRLRVAPPPGTDHYPTVVELVKFLIPSPTQKIPSPQALLSVLRLIPSDRQRMIVKFILTDDRMREADANALGRALGEALGIKIEDVKAEEAVPVEVERQRAWDRIRDLITGRNDPSVITAAIRDRLHAKYDADEVRASWLTLIEADAISLIRVFCLLPYRADGRTDSIAQPVMETYISRLTHEKYASTYNKIVNSLRNMFHAKPDSPTLLNFVALVRWVSPEAASRLCHDVGMPG